MDTSNIIKIISSKYQEVDSSATYLNTYSKVTYQNLVTKQVSNRASKGWGKANYIIVEANDEKSIPSIDDLLDKWKELSSSYKNQFLILEYPNGVWNMFDYSGQLMGDEDYIANYFSIPLIPKHYNLIFFIST